MTNNNMRWTLAAVILIAGCASAEYRYVSTQSLKNSDGHVIGQTEVLQDIKTGEQFERTVYYTPRFDDKGTLVGYDEPVRSGTVIRDVNGRRIGVRDVDLRSRGPNPQNQGMTVIIPPKTPAQ